MVEVKTFCNALQPIMPLYRYVSGPEDTMVGAQYLVPVSALGSQSAAFCNLLTLQPAQTGVYSNNEQPYEVFDRTTCLNETNNTEIPCLLVPRAIGLSQFGMPVRDVRNEGLPISKDAILNAELFDWQKTVVDHAEARLRSPPYFGGVIQASCGLGKTLLAIALAMRLRIKVAVAVNKEFLASQWIDRVQTFTRNLSVGRVQGDRCVIADFTVVMLQTISSGRYPPETFQSIGLLIVDEVHHLPARTFSQVAKYFTAKMTLGLSATLKRGDGNERCVFWQLGPLITTVQRELPRSDAVQMKVSVKIVRGVKSVEPTRNGRLDRVRLITLLVDNAQRNEIINENLKTAIDEGYNVLVISERIDQLKQLTSLLGRDSAYPLPLEYVGERTQKRRKQRDSGLLESPRVVMTTKQMAAEAFDWKDCTAVLLATPVPVGGILEQIIGRCQRSGKEEDLRPRLIIDIGDTSPILSGMTRSRNSWYHRKAYAIVGSASDSLPLEAPA